ncbi:MAG: SIMPL domain-containing protein [Pseudomonadota bacterium]|nr:SIMPL domain-containing protein [Pseudomonadota bacterium]
MQAAPRFTFRPLVMAAALALGTIATMTAAAQTAPAYFTSDGTLLSVSTQAEVKRVPDIATLSAGVVTQAADANAAMRANANQMSKVVVAIRAAGINERDIQTSGVNLNPQYDYRDNQPPTITGYQASNTVSITVRDIGELGDILDALVANGANQVNGPSYDVDDKESAFDEARRAAIEKARTRADMYARTLGLRVRRIVSISEGGGFNPPMPMPMMAMARMEKDQASTPIAPGENTLSVNLDLVFELGKQA